MGFPHATRPLPSFICIKHGKIATYIYRSFLKPLGLPLGLLGVDKLLEDAHDLLQGGKVGRHLLGDLGLVVTELGVEVFSVWAGAHGGAEDGLDDEAVVRLEGGAVGVAEGVCELLGGVGDVGLEAEAGELETTVKEDVLTDVFLKRG